MIRSWHSQLTLPRKISREQKLWDEYMRNIYTQRRVSNFHVLFFRTILVRISLEYIIVTISPRHLLSNQQKMVSYHLLMTFGFPLSNLIH